MQAQSATRGRPTATSPIVSGLTRAWATLTPRSAVAIAFAAVTLFLFVFGPLVAPYSATAFHTAHALQPPGRGFLFGTDEYGRDVFSRILYGARPTLGLALASAVLGVGLGTLTGLGTGYFKGVFDESVMRVMDALMSFPALILAMLIVVMLGSNTVNVVLAIGIVFWPRSARIVRSVASGVAAREFVDAAVARGESAVFIMFRELLPNLWTIIVVDLSLRITYGILLSASLAYLGIGVEPPNPAWGLMVKEGQQYIQLAPWLVIFPCLAVSIAAIGMVLLGETLRERLAVGRTRWVR